MKRTRYILYAALLTGVALLLAGAAFLLWSPGTHISKEASQVKGRQLPELSNEVSDHIQKARAAAVELSKLTWDEFADAGLLPPPGGMCALGNRVGEREQFGERSDCKWTPLPEMLPRPESAGTLSVYCDMSLEMVEKLSAARPSDNSTLPQWLELCRQLQSDLRGGEHLALSYKDTNSFALAKMEEGINKSDAAIIKKYLDKFQSKSAKYLGLLDEFITNFQQAEQATSQLANWQFEGTATIPGE
jgi:hypothetical protein